MAIAARGVWQHVVGTFDGSIARLYVDGVMVAGNGAKQFRPPKNGVTDIFVIGGGPSADGTTSTSKIPPYEGIVDEVASYAHALGITEVSAHFRLGRMQTRHFAPTAVEDDNGNIASLIESVYAKSTSTVQTRRSPCTL